MPQNETTSEWSTYCELSGYRKTPPYDETIEYAKRLADGSSLIRFESFGKSGEERDLPLLIATEGETFTPASARENGKAVILVQACIHSGEPDGKDAGLALLRDIAITKLHPHLLQNLVLIFIPIYNVDGHERSSPFNRINQNGPDDLGWRATTTNQNLNRDYMKADTPETRSWLALWNKWKPDLFIDCHVTDGADYRYNITYQFEHHAGVAPSILDWEREVIDGKVFPATEAAGNLLSWYLEFVDNRDLTLGIRDFNGSPRFSTGYVPLRNRPGVLIETHMLKDYRSRVVGTYDFLRFTLEEVSRDPERLLSAISEADKNPIGAISKDDSGGLYPLDFELTNQARPYELKAVEYHREMSEVSGAVRVVFGAQPLDLTVPMFDNFRTRLAVEPPAYYIIPPQWSEVIEVLGYHGVEMERTLEPYELEVESYRFENVSWANAPFEGRFLTRFTAIGTAGPRRFPVGSVLVPTDQTLVKVAINLLEPEAPDSLVVWGFFSAIFEQKEYGEDYVLEDLARKMLADDANLREEFESKVANDVAFRSDSYKRLQFFYRRSRYWDPYMNVYPVGRIMARQNLRTNKLS